MPNETSNRESIPRINNIGINNLALYGYLLNVPDKLNLSSITGKLPVTKIFGKNMNIGNLKSLTNTASIAGAAGTAVSAILGDKSEYSGDKGYISKGMDSAYDTLSDAVSVIPGWGLAASGIMKAAGAMNLVMGKLGNSNDGMTTQDAILSSKLFNFGGLNPVSMVANYGGKRSILLKDRGYQDLLSLIDSNEAYTASANTLQDARSKAGKKYSLFSNGARHGANNLINQADLESDIRLRISDDRDLSMIRSQSQTSINNLGYSNLISGGLNPIAVGKRGMKMKRSRLKNIVNKANSINSFLKGGKSSGTRNIELLIIYANNLKPPFILRILNNDERTYTFPDGKIGTHLLNYDTYNGKTYVFPEIQQDPSGNLWWYKDRALDRALERNNVLEMSPEEAEIFVKEYKKYYPNFKPFKMEGGGELSYFKSGGQMNVIPEGALHARKNNMEGAGEDFTAKGIPVVDNNGELQAEIERNEVIFNKEVTDFIEKNYKKFKSEETSNSEKDEIAIKVGKRLVKELLENTQDNTGLIQEVLEKM